MLTLITAFKKVVLAGSMLAIGLGAFPALGASATGITESATHRAAPTRENTRLENIWAREQTVYQRQENLLDRADNLIAKAQTLIDKAGAKGWDTSEVQAALNAFATAIQTAQSSHENGAAIIAGHAGFDENGRVIDRAAAIATTRSLRQVIKNTRAALDGTGKALLLAIKDFRLAHRPAPVQ